MKGGKKVFNYNMNVLKVNEYMYHEVKTKMPVEKKSREQKRYPGGR